MRNIFTDHPNQQNESYIKHAKFALTCGLTLIFLGFIAIVHAIFPFLFETTVSKKIEKLQEKFKSR